PPRTIGQQVRQQTALICAGSPSCRWRRDCGRRPQSVIQRVVHDLFNSPTASNLDCGVVMPGQRAGSQSPTRGVSMRAEEGDEPIDELADKAEKTQKNIDEAVEGEGKEDKEAKEGKPSR